MSALYFRDVAIDRFFIVITNISLIIAVGYNATVGQ